ncbi:hypothetical protein BDV19DRAFT_390500 [Aspergillus venezuelensis]
MERPQQTSNGPGLESLTTTLSGTGPANLPANTVDPAKRPRKDFWEIAYQSMSEDEQSSLRALRTRRGDESISAVLDDTITTVEAQFQIRQLKDNFSSETITGIAAVDPTGHASSAWAVVSLGLRIAHNDHALQDVLFGACEFLTGILARYTVVDNLVRQAHVDTVDMMEQRPSILPTFMIDALVSYSKDAKCDLQGRMEALQSLRNLDTLTSAALSILESMILDENARIMGLAVDAYCVHAALLEVVQQHLNSPNVEVKAMAVGALSKHFHQPGFITDVTRLLKFDSYEHHDLLLSIERVLKDQPFLPLDTLEILVQLLIQDPDHFAFLCFEVLCGQGALPPRVMSSLTLALAIEDDPWIRLIIWVILQKHGCFLTTLPDLPQQCLVAVFTVWLKLASEDFCCYFWNDAMYIDLPE